jgi:hypothetical protein
MKLYIYTTISSLNFYSIPCLVSYSINCRKAMKLSFHLRYSLINKSSLQKSLINFFIKELTITIYNISDEEVLIRYVFYKISLVYFYHKRFILQWSAAYEEFEDNKEVIRIRRSKRDRQHNDQRIKGQKDKLWSTKHYA